MENLGGYSIVTISIALAKSFQVNTSFPSVLKAQGRMAQ
jgi:hypothetical protein